MPSLLPDKGEQISFRANDCTNHPDPVTVRVERAEIVDGKFTVVDGWKLDDHGFPAERVRLRVGFHILAGRRTYNPRSM